MTVGFTKKQIDHICYEIGEWYLEWRDKMWVGNKPNEHWLGRAKEQLKIMICGEKYEDNSPLLKTRFERIQEETNFLRNVGLVFGFVHGGIASILESPDSEMREKLTDLNNKLNKNVHDLYYAERQKEGMQ